MPKEKHRIAFPGAEVLPGASVVVPVAAVLGPLGDVSGIRVWANGNRVGSGQVQEFAQAEFGAAAIESCSFWGPVIHAPKVKFVHQGAEQVHDVHELDLSNLFVVNRFWAVGSCPHLFAIDHLGAVTYLGEVLSGKPGVTQTHLIGVEAAMDKLVIAELEDERTQILSVSQGALTYAQQVTLDKGDYLTIPILDAGQVRIEGSYELLCASPSHAQKSRVRTLQQIEEFCAHLNESRVSAGDLRRAREYAQIDHLDAMRTH